MSQDSPAQGIRHLDEDRVIDLLNGLATDADRQAALSHMQTCPRCERLFGDRLKDRERLRAAGVPRDLHGLYGRHATRAMPRRTFVSVGVVAAMTVVAILGVWLSQRGDHPDYWVPIEFQRTEITRSADAERDMRFEKVVAAYSRQDAAAVIELLQNENTSNRMSEMNDVLEQLMLASAYANTGKPEMALQVTSRLKLATVPLPWRNRGSWIEFVSLRDLRRDDEAQALLQELAKETDEVGVMARDEIARRAR